MVNVSQEIGNVMNSQIVMTTAMKQIHYVSQCDHVMSFFDATVLKPRPMPMPYAYTHRNWLLCSMLPGLYIRHKNFWGFCKELIIRVEPEPDPTQRFEVYHRPPRTRWFEV